MDTSRKIGIATYNLSKSLMSSLNVLFDKESDIIFFLSKDKDELIGVFDTNSDKNVELLMKYLHQYPHRWLISISKDIIEHHHVTTISPPVSPQRLLNAILKTAEKIEKSESQNSQTTTAMLKKNKGKKIHIDLEKKSDNKLYSTSNVDLNSPQQISTIQYSAKRYLQGHLKNIYHKSQFENRNLKLHTSHETFTYDLKTHRVSISSKNFSLENLARIPDDNISIIPCPENIELSDKNSKQHFICADALLWQSTILASRGRLPAGVDVDKKFCLKKWPNLSRWMMSPHAMEITALWVKTPISLKETVELMQIPQRFIFTFYCAAEALELINFNTETPKDKARNNKKPGVRLNSFLGKILNYVKNEGTEK